MFPAAPNVAEKEASQMFDIITDSACDLTLDTAKQLQIEVVPFYVSLDGEHYRKEGKEIAVRDFYQFMVDNPSAYPKTSLASIEDFEQAFRAHAAAGRDVLCLVFTSKMSGCVGSARNARDLVLEDFPDARIEVIDSAAATVTESTMVENAVAMRDAGCTMDETVTWLEAEKATNQIFFTVGNLDYLIKGGRIGKVTGRAANMLGIKPMILFKDGEIFSGGVARGRQKSFEKALEQLMNYLDAHGGTPDDYRITVGYGYDADEGYTLRVSGYTFGKRYAVEASSEFENVQVTIAFEAEFVALPEKIEVTLPAATLAYDATEELFVAEDTSVVGELFEQVKDHFTDAAELATSLTRPYYGGSPNSANAFYTAVCGDRTLEKNYWFLDGSNPATITRIAVANDGKMTSHMQVNRADVETDADVFAFETKLVPNYGLPIYVKGEARVEIPAYAAQHVDAWVYNADGKWQSDVKGLWSPSFGSSALTGFSVADIDLESAFTIVKKDAQGVWVPVSDDEIAAQKLVFAYEIPATAPAHDGIEIAGNKLSYYGRNESVPVVGTLSIDGIVIGNAFTAVNDYTSYEVNKFDPIRSFTQSETVEIPTRTAEATYTKNICEVLSLRDMRDADDMKGFELIDHDATLADPWITGDDTNGFATGVRPNSDKVFGLEAIRIVSFSVTYADNGFDASAALGDRVTVDETTGQITFSNLNNLSLQKDVDVTVNVEVAYPWAVKSGKVTYKILK